MNNPRSVLILFWVGLLFAFAFACVATWSLIQILHTNSAADVANTAWNMDGAVFKLWAFSVPIGSLLAVIGALLFVKANRAFIWTIAVGFPVIVVPTIIVFSSRYYPWGFYGLGGSLILLLFFSLVWLWMKKAARQDQQENTA